MVTRTNDRRTPKRRARGRATARLRASLAGAIVAVAAMTGARVAGAQPVNVTPPVVIQHVDAVYPASAQADRAHGDVVLALTVDVDGHVSKVDVVESGGANLDEAATVAARQWTFTPAMRAGKPVASRIRVPFHFAPPAPPPELVAPLKKSDDPELPPTQAVPREPSPPAPGSSAAPPATTAPADAEEVRVVGQATPPNHGASDFTVRVGELARVPRQNASELLKLAPGMMLSNEGGEGHAEQVFLRGFDAREGQDIEFTANGVPINESGNLHGNGYADTHFIIPECVEGLRVVEGPFDPRQGNYAVAGSANYQLGLEQRGLTGKATAGSFGTQRMLVTYGPRESSAHTFACGEIYKTDGYGQNRDASRGTAMGQYEGALGSTGSWRAGVSAYTTHYHSAGVLRQDDFRAGRVNFYDSYDVSSFARQQVPEGGDSSRYSAWGDIETRAGDTTFTQQVFAIQRGMRLLENFTGFLLDVQTPLQQIHAQRGDMLDLSVQSVTVGARGSARMHGEALGQRQELELGYLVRGDDVHGTQQRLEAGTGVPYATETDLQSQLGDLGFYGDANLSATKWLHLRGGARADVFTFNVLDNCAARSVAHPSATNPPIDQSCLTQQDFGRHREADQRTSTASTAFLPRATVLVGPVKDVTFSASYGQGVRSIDPGYITQDVKTPFASVNAYEAGASYAGQIRDVALTARSIFFETHVDRDLLFSETVGRNVLGNGTTRTGWSGAARATGSFFDEAANLTFVKSAYDDTHLLVAYVPSTVIRSDTAFFADLPFRVQGSKVRGALGSGITYVGPRALPYGQKSQDIVTVDASATLTWTHYEVALVATNLLDRRNRIGEYNFASDFHSQSQPTLVPERHFTVGAPRGLFATLGVNFGGT